ncbi:hypothetical protein [Actinomadura sediminis]|uniref:Uncharacterized protein n=1 Tax=Actinomadura sediminis TaxID=1038904 RepID=A0ABW3F372_9ACTN
MEEAFSAMSATVVVSATESGQNGIGRLRDRRDDRPDEWISVARMRILMPGRAQPEQISKASDGKIYPVTRKAAVRRNPQERAR